jgi:glucose/arabinose dehydrogenase
MAGRQQRRTAILVMALALAAGACGQVGDQEARRTSGSGSTPSTARSVPTTSVPPARPPTQAELNRVAVELHPVVRVQTPVALAVPEDNTTFYVGQRAGLVRVIRDGRLDPRPLLDLTDQVVVEGEGGLLGVALAPDGRRLYVSFTDAKLAVRLVEVTLDADGVDPGSRREVLTIPQPSTRHHGGNIVFGPDGLLWLGVGDGSAGGDPANAAQSLGVLSGKLLRLDPTPSGDKGYTVPATNPFVKRTGARPEIWAFGLRNPWRFGFDRATGDLWIGDVGSATYEEVNYQPAASPGGENYGWDVMEGRVCRTDGDCNEFVAPVSGFDRDEGCVVTGGYVYRGTGMPQLEGVYLFADYCSGRVWGLLRDASNVWIRLDPVETGLRISSFGEDATGELYVVDIQGAIYRVLAS